MTLSDGTVELVSVPLSEEEIDSLFGNMVMWHSVCGLLHGGGQPCSEGIEDTQPCNCCGMPAAEMNAEMKADKYGRPCGPGQWHVADGPMCSHLD